MCCVFCFVFLQFNFVGKLLGPRGNSLKRLQEETLTKMSILGKGSMRDKTKVRSDSVGGVFTYLKFLMRGTNLAMKLEKIKRIGDDNTDFWLMSLFGQSSQDSACSGQTKPIDVK